MKFLVLIFTLFAISSYANEVGSPYDALDPNGTPGATVVAPAYSPKICPCNDLPVTLDGIVEPQGELPTVRAQSPGTPTEDKNDI